MNGFNVQISFQHQPQYGKPTLVYDVIEEYRTQVVDRVVISSLTKGARPKLGSDGYLNHVSKNKLLHNVLQRLKTPVRYRTTEKTYEEIIHLQIKQLAAFLKDEKPSYKPYISKW